MHWSRGYHALITWLMTHVSRDWSCNDHVANMYWSRDWSCNGNVIDHALITWLIMHWSRDWIRSLRGTGLVPGWGAKIPQATWHGKKKSEFVQAFLSTFSGQIGIYFKSISLPYLAQQMIRHLPHYFPYNMSLKIGYIHDPFNRDCTRRQNKLCLLRLSELKWSF